MFKIAVIGAGPSGLYLCSRLIKKLPNSIIDIFERRSEPFGLLRFGVAPDNLTIRVRNINFSIHEYLAISKTIRYSSFQPER